MSDDLPGASVLSADDDDNESRDSQTSSSSTSKLTRDHPSNKNVGERNK